VADPSVGAASAYDLPVGDVDALIVALRIEHLGDRLIAEGLCGSCDARVDIDFGLAAYREHNRPRRSKLAAPDEAEPGWWRLHRSPTWFRLPTAGDVLAAGTADDGHAALLAACVRGDLSASAVRSAERAMETLAPTLRTEVRGGCPECGVAVDMDVDARGLCMAELGFLAGSVLDETHLLAATYHWSEQAILDLPSSRRAAYAERVRASRTMTAPVEVWGG
jgi:hypothetical protein